MWKPGIPIPTTLNTTTDAVQVGTANFVDPLVWTKLLDGLRSYMQRHGIVRAADLVGTVDIRAEDKEWTAS